MNTVREITITRELVTEKEQIWQEHITRLYEKFPPPNPRGADRGAHVRSSNL